MINIILYGFAAIYLLSAISTIGLIDKPRKPLSAGTVKAIVTIDVLVAILLIFLATGVWS